MTSPGNKSNSIRKFLTAVFLVVLSVIIVLQASSQETEKYSDLKKENISEESNEALKEYYGSVLSTIGEESKFNTISTKEGIAILNVTVDGRDRRILTRLSKGIAIQKPSTDIIYAQLIQSYNLTVLGNLEISGKEFFLLETDYGSRNFFSIKAPSERLIDEGNSRLTDGIANVSINPIFAELAKSYNVYLSPRGLTKGLYVAEKASDYFVVKGVNKKSNVAFSWLLSGSLSDKLYEQSVEDDLGIRVIIDSEAGTAEIEIIGLTSANSSFSYDLITGNVVLEEDLSAILEDIPTPLPTIEKDKVKENVTNEILLNESQNTNVKGIKFRLYKTDEGYIIQQIVSVTGLTPEAVKSRINFSYKVPEDFADEQVEEYPQMKGIESSNGSIVIRLGE